MAAGQGFKTFTTGEVLTAADTNGYLMQGVLVFADAAARTAAITSPQEGQVSYLKDTNVTQYYSGSAWVNVGGGSPLTTKGDLYTYSTTDARLAVGTNGQALVADSTTATGLKWASPPSGATLISRTTFSASSSVIVDNLFSSTYENYLVCIQARSSVGNTQLQMRGRYGSTTESSNLYQYGLSGIDTSSATLRTLYNSNVGQWMLGVLSSSSNENICNLTFYRPDSAGWLQFTGTTRSVYDGQNLSGGGFIETAQSWGGLQLFPATGTITGRISVYGLAEA